MAQTSNPERYEFEGKNDRVTSLVQGQGIWAAQIMSQKRQWRNSKRETTIAKDDGKTTG